MSRTMDAVLQALSGHRDATRASMIIPAPLRAGVADLVLAIEMLHRRCQALEARCQELAEQQREPCEGCGGEPVKVGGTD